MKYLVTWGTEQHEVDVACEADAWPSFCAMVPAAFKHPNQHPRTVVEVPVVDKSAEELADFLLDSLEEPLHEVEVVLAPTPEALDEVLEHPGIEGDGVEVELFQRL